MKLRNQALAKSGSKAGAKRALAASVAPKRISPSKKSAPKKSAPKKAAAKKPAAKKAAPAKKPVAAAKPNPAPAGPRLATPLSSNGQPQSVAPKPAAAAPRPAGTQSAEDRRRAATRKFFARLRSLEAIVGADLRKRGSVVLMQAVDQWYSEAINANATDVTITNAAKAVIAQL